MSVGVESTFLDRERLKGKGRHMLFAANLYICSRGSECPSLHGEHCPNVHRKVCLGTEHAADVESASDAFNKAYAPLPPGGEIVCKPSKSHVQRYCRGCGSPLAFGERVNCLSCRVALGDSWPSCDSAPRTQEAKVDRAQALADLRNAVDEHGRCHANFKRVTDMIASASSSERARARVELANAEQEVIRRAYSVFGMATQSISAGLQGYLKIMCDGEEVGCSPMESDGGVFTPQDHWYGLDDFIIERLPDISVEAAEDIAAEVMGDICASVEVPREVQSHGMTFQLTWED